MNMKIKNFNEQLIRWPLRSLKKIFKNTNHAIVNFETTILNNYQVVNKERTLNTCSEG